jgi:hypothetical protein
MPTDVERLDVDAWPRGRLARVISSDGRYVAFGGTFGSPVDSHGFLLGIRTVPGNLDSANSMATLVKTFTS